MEKEKVKISEYWITKIDKNSYEMENSKQKLDFYFIVKRSKGVEVIVFDSLISTSDKAYLGIFFSESLKVAVNDAMQLTKENVRNVVMWS